jgi:hypothetical protein
LYCDDPAFRSPLFSQSFFLAQPKHAVGDQRGEPSPAMRDDDAFAQKTGTWRAVTSTSFFRAPARDDVKIIFPRAGT